MTDVGANCGSPCVPDPVRHAASGRESRHYAEPFPRERFQGGGLVLTAWLRGGLGTASWEQPYMQQPCSYLHGTGVSHAPAAGCFCSWALISSKRKFSGTACQTSPGLSPRAGKPYRASGLGRQGAWLPVGSAWLGSSEGLPRHGDYGMK